MNEPIDTSRLDPVTLAKHLGNPRGEIGRAVAANLNNSNAGGYSAALAKLGVNAGDRVIEIGFGNGRGNPEGSFAFGRCELSRPRHLGYHGGRSRRVQCRRRASRPGEPRAWQQRRNSRRCECVRQGACDQYDLFLVGSRCRPKGNSPRSRSGWTSCARRACPASAAGRPVFQHGFRFHEESEIENLLLSAGFRKVSIDTINETIVLPTGQPWNRDYFIVVAE
jgi:hypothetical protein